MSERDDVLHEAEGVVVAFLRNVPAWQAVGGPAMVDCEVEHLALDTARLFADLRREPRPASTRPTRQRQP